MEKNRERKGERSEPHSEPTWFKVFGFKRWDGGGGECVMGLWKEDRIEFFWDNDVKRYDYIRVCEYDWRAERALHRKIWENENENVGEYPYVFEDGDDPMDLNSEMSDPVKFEMKYGERFKNG